MGLGFRGVPKMRGTTLGVPITRIIGFWGSIPGPPYLGKSPFWFAGNELTDPYSCAIYVS